MRFLTAAQLDDLADRAEAFQIVLLDAYEASGHAWAEATAWTEDGLPLRGDKRCVLCGEPMPCGTFGEVVKADAAVRRALLGLGVWEEVLTDADARHSPGPPPPLAWERDRGELMTPDEMKTRREERRLELAAHQAAVAQRQKERAVQIERGEDPGPWLRLIMGERSQR